MYVVVDRIACRMDSSSAKPASRTIKSARRELTESIRQSGQARWAGQKVNITTPTTTTPLPPPPPPSPLTRSTHPTPTVLTRDTLILKYPSPLLPRRTASDTACKPTPRRNRASPAPHHGSITPSSATTAQPEDTSTYHSRQDGGGCRA